MKCLLKIMKMVKLVIDLLGLLIDRISNRLIFKDLSW